MTTTDTDLIAPMLATDIPAGLTGEAFDRFFRHGWALEEKHNGHRLTVQTHQGDVRAWSRPRGRKPALPRKLPPPMLIALRHLGTCDVDGELVAVSGTNSRTPGGVVTKGAQLVYVIFDIRTTCGWSVMDEPYEKRRSILLDHLRKLPDGQQSVSTVLSIVPPTWEVFQAIKAHGGEGAVMKRLSSQYQPGLRSPDWLRIKETGTGESQ